MSHMLITEMERMDTGIPMEYMMALGNIVTKLELGFSYGDVDVRNIKYNDGSCADY